MRDDPTTDLETLYRNCGERLFRCALAITRCPDRAEDAVHDAFAGLLRRREPLVDPVAYAFRAVRNAAINQVSRRRREAAWDPDALLDESAEPGDLAARGELRGLILRAVCELPAKEREVVALHVFGELTFREVSESLGEPEGTVASRFYRALERIHSRVKECPWTR